MLTVRFLTKRIRMKRAPPRASRRAPRAQRHKTRDPSAPPRAPCVPPRPMPCAPRPFPSPGHGTRPATEAPRPTQNACCRAEALAHRALPVMPTAASYAPTLHVPRHPMPHTPSLATRSACRTPTCAHRGLPRRTRTTMPRTPYPMGHTLTNAHLYSPQSARRAPRAAPRPVRLGAPRGQRSPPRPISGAPRPRRALSTSPRPARHPLLCGMRQRAQRQARRGTGPTRRTWPRQSCAPPHVVPSTRGTLPRHEPRRALHLSRTDALHGHPTLPTAHCPRDARRPALHDTIVFFRAIL